MAPQLVLKWLWNILLAVYAHLDVMSIITSDDEQASDDAG